jgi:hypothetical protein
MTSYHKRAIKALQEGKMKPKKMARKGKIWKIVLVCG